MGDASVLLAVVAGKMKSAEGYRPLSAETLLY